MDWAYILLQKPSANALFEYLQQHGVTHDYLEGLALPPSDAKPYGRKVLYDGVEGEVLLVSWAEEVYTALHDHGKGSGTICFYSGEYIEEYWSWDTDKGLQFRTKASRLAGDVCEVRAKEIHRVRSKKYGSLSLHLYLPSSSGMRVFSPEKECYYLVTDDCGAWEPDLTQIIKTVAW